MPGKSYEMSSRKSLFSAAGITLGGIGIVVCLVSMIILWMGGIRIGRVTESLFGKLDRSLAVVRQRVVQTQDRVAAATITSQDIEKSLRDWTKREASQQITLRLNAVEKTERLASTLQQADHWLDVSESSVGLVQDMLSIGASTNVPAVTTSVDQLMEEIASLRGQLAEVLEFVNRIHDRVAEAGEEKSAEERTEQVVQIILRVVATLGTIDSRLEKTADRLLVTQGHFQELKTGTQWWIFVITIGVTLLILLMAAGQVALCRLFWTGFRRIDAPI